MTLLVGMTELIGSASRPPSFALEGQPRRLSPHEPWLKQHGPGRGLLAYWRGAI